jgi:hypothetical protein
VAKDRNRNAAEGEVVYRRVATRANDVTSRGPNQPRFDPTLMPLLVGCALLLLFVIVLGNLSVRRVEDTSREVLILEQIARRCRRRHSGELFTTIWLLMSRRRKTLRPIA